LEKNALLKQLTIFDFMATDLHLFLDTHPNDGEALKVYNDICAKAREIRKQYEAHCGPLFSYRSPGAAHWPWEAEPWPWQADFNFKLADAGHAHGYPRADIHPWGEERL